MGEDAAGRTTREKAFRYRVAHQLLHCVAHRTRTQLRMKPFPHQERQRRLVEFDFVTAHRQKLDLAGKKLLRNLQLMLLAQTVEHELLIHAGEDLRAQSLLRTGEDMAFEGGFV